MTATLIVISMALSLMVYLVLGLLFSKKAKRLADLIPIERGSLARVANSREFSASTVAVTISLATVVLAYFELAPWAGLWLLWSVVTTGLGILAVRIMAPRIVRRLDSYGRRRPSLHEFLGTEFGAPTLAVVAASCTSLGFLGAFGVELTVGSRFLAQLTGFPPLSMVMLLAIVAMAYTALGGFRVVIITDRIQMRSIWILILALAVYYVVFVTDQGLSNSFQKIPRSIYDFSWRDGLLAFMIGLFVINVPTFISDMSIWQRIGGTQDIQSVFGGLVRSVAGASITWAFLAFLACMAFVATQGFSDVNPLIALLETIGGHSSLFNGAIVFCVGLGLLGALLSTASTQLIVVAHTVEEDILATSLPALGDSLHKRQLLTPRLIIVSTAILSIAVVEILSSAGFSVADLVFAVWGAQLGLFGPVLLALLWDRQRLRKMINWASLAISLGFVAGWSTAGYGKAIGNANLVFLAPASSLVVSSVLLAVGIIKARVLRRLA